MQLDGMNALNFGIGFCENIELMRLWLCNVTYSKQRYAFWHNDKRKQPNCSLYVCACSPILALHASQFEDKILFILLLLLY